MSTTATAVIDRRVLVREDQLRLGLWMFLGTVTMLFAAFASAFIVRRSGTEVPASRGKAYKQRRSNER